MKRYAYDYPKDDSAFTVKDEGDWVKYGEAARILAQRDRLTELLRAYLFWSNGRKSHMNDRWFTQVSDLLAEIDKGKTL